jgi:uncharacterized protein
MCLPNGIWASPVKSADEINETMLARVLESPAPEVTTDHFLIGTGKDLLVLPPRLREVFRARHIVLEAMSTGAAVRTYNILLGERRRVGALFVAVE